MRDEDEHQRRCIVLSSALTVRAQKYWSKVYGINRSSVSLSLPGFKVTECFLHDPMHLLFKGVTGIELKVLLNYLIFERKFFQLSFLNQRLLELAKQLPADCRPNLIEITQLQDGNLKQTSHQMWYLSHLVPLAVASKVPDHDAKWKNFIRLLQIQQLSTSPIALDTTVECLTIVVARHNVSYKEIYPDQSFIPKLHYLVHLPEQIRKFGPCRNHWCLRMEAKNSIFKKSKLCNTKNVPKTVSFAHQRWMCCMQHDSKGNVASRFFNPVLKTKITKQISFDNCYAHYDTLLNYLQLRMQPIPDSIVNTLEVEHNGIVYKQGNILLTSVSPYKNVVFVDDIILLSNDEILFLATTCHLDYFLLHTNCYAIKCSVPANKIVVSQKALQIPWPMLKFDKNGEIIVIPLCLPDLDEIM